MKMAAQSRCLQDLLLTKAFAVEGRDVFNFYIIKAFRPKSTGKPKLVARTGVRIPI
jgi:hypothetical protein